MRSRAKTRPHCRLRKIIVPRLFEQAARVRTRLNDILKQAVLGTRMARAPKYIRFLVHYDAIPVSLCFAAFSGNANIKALQYYGLLERER